MKKFVIFSYSIVGMGGGQMYQYNKVSFMNKRNYETYIIYAIPGKVIIEDINNCSKIKCIEALNINPLILTKAHLNKTISEICNFIGEMDEHCIIESCNKVTSLWGEIIARKTGAICYPFIIDEKIGSLDDEIMTYFEYKRDKGELKGIKSQTYEMIFGRHPKEDNYDYCLPIPGNNVVANIETTMDKYVPNTGKRICSIGRLDKAYVDTLVQEIYKYISNHRDENYYVAFIGDDSNKTHMDIIKAKLSKLNNATVTMFGSVYPIPERLLYEFDLFISSAGSARVSGDRAIPTITIDARDFQSIGIYQYETDNTVFRDGEVAIPISEKIEYVFEHYDEIRTSLYKKTEVDFDEVFENHLNYYLSHNHSEKYYDVMSMKLDKKKKIEKIIYQCLGKKIYDKIRNFVFSKI